MHGSSRLICEVFLAFLIAGAPTVGAAQQSRSGTATQALKDRANGFYQAIQKDDRVSAMALVAPQSRNDFLKMNFEGLVDARVKEVELDKSGDAATVTIIRTRKVPMIPAPLDYETQDSWRLIDGQWYLVVPSIQEMDTPFGKMKFGQQTPSTPADVQMEMKKRLSDVDPDQYTKALQKATRQPAQTDKKAEPEDKKPEAKKPEDKKPDKP